MANDSGRPAPHPGPRRATDGPGAQAAGIPLSSSEGTAQHFHAHLNVIIDGRPIPVPADLGVDQAGARLGALHTHDGSGVLQLESPDPNNRYILGQVFNEWNVRLTATAIGNLSAGNGKTFTAYVNGRRVEGNPAAIPLGEHAEIALLYGTPSTQPTPPATYDFGRL